ncbi:MAG: hypothetical protein H5T74_13850 [Actinobacteria bacterium]|nr:hypothetical protein [Actinomycetota bacterium]MDI6831479.1 hypothetical protein [Actinomycetota bacterium]
MRKRGKGACLLVACLAVATALLVAACGEKSGEGLLKRELPENATPEKIMLEGLNATDEAKTLHYLFDYSFVIPPTGKQAYTSEVALNGEGDYHAASGNAKARVRWPSFDLEFDYVLYEGVQYYRTEESDTWYELPAGSSLSIPSISEITRNTAEYMDNFQKITRLQDEVVDGRDCYHIAMVPNFDAIMENQQFLDMIRGDREQLDEETLQKIEEIKQELKDASVNYEYWFDKETLVLRRTLYNIEMVEKGEGEDSSYTVKMIMEITFPLYNQEVEITRPEPAMLYKG